MADEGRTPAGSPRGRVGKRQAITRAARVVFGRDGYAAAGIDAIAAAAGVSTRTIYNHFAGKEELFSAVVADSAAVVVNALGEIFERHLGEVTDLEADLVALGCAWARMQVELADHVAVSRLVRTETAHVPSSLVQVWHEGGPTRAQRELARHFRRLAHEGLLHVEDPERAANHFIWLSLGELTSIQSLGLAPLTEAEVVDTVAAGVRAFLRGYLPRPTA